MRLIKLSHEDLTIFGHDISAADYSFFAKHKDAFRRMFREQGLMFWRRFMVSFKAYTMSYGIIENPLQKTNGKQYYQMVSEAYNYLECQIMRNTTSAPKVFVEDSGILAQSRHLLGGIEAKPYKASKDPFYMKDTREVFRRVFGDPKDGPYLTLRVYIMYPLCMKMGATLCRLLRKWLDSQDGTEDDIYWTHPSVDLFFSFGFHDDISRLRHDIDELRKERGPHNVDIPRPMHQYPRDTLPDELKQPETTPANRADILAAKKEEKRLKKKGKESDAATGDGKNTTITGLEMKRGADGTKFKVQFAQGGVSHVDVTRKGEEVKIKVTRTSKTNGKQENDERLQKVLKESVDTIQKKGKTKEQIEKEEKKKGKTKEQIEKEEKEEREEREYRKHREADAKAVEEAWKKTKEANKGKPRSAESEYLRKKAKETFAEIDKGEGKKFGLDDPLIKLFREAVEDSDEGEVEGETKPPESPTPSDTSSSSSSSSSKKKRECANCKSVEEVRKTYKACQRCRERKVKKIKYYCSRTCQVKDWEATHKKEHRDLANKIKTAELQQPEGDEDPLIQS